ncbi:hypothetical protein FACS1894164_04460 [Spirochaetia bacterium]|nr:hypothetical protein FACS1894164_04460 [Spirochaetia bacterium]
MIRPQKMKQIRMSVLERDIDHVIEFLGRSALMQISDSQPKSETSYVSNPDYLEQLRDAALWLKIAVPEEPEESSQLPDETENKQAESLISAIHTLQERETVLNDDMLKISEALGEVRAFANLNAPFSEFDQLSYLTLRLGRLDPERHKEVEENMAGRAVILSLGEGDRVLTATSRNGRFALDSELKRQGFVPVSMPEDFQGVPSELLSGLEAKLAECTKNWDSFLVEKAKIAADYAPQVQKLAADYLLANLVENLRARLVSTKSTYQLTGWVPAASVRYVVEKVEALTGNRVALRTFEPDEVESIRNGTEKVPVSLKHGAIVKGFEPLIFSYGAPAYNTIDPTPFVAGFFAVLFGIMFGDVGQGLVLFILGIAAGNKNIQFFKNYRNFSIPMKTVGVTSMFMGLLYGSVFSYENLLIAPTRAITGLLTGHPVDRVLHLMPEASNMTKVFYFLGFTIALGVVLNSIGLIINIINQITLKHYERAFFSRTGLAGALFFWYVLFMAVRIFFFHGKAAWFDIVGIGLPAFVIFFGPLIWNLISGERPLFKEGIVTFLVEGVVEILETVSGYFSNTVSFLRVGAFALSHVILSFIVFTMVEKLSGLSFGPLWSLIIALFGNLVIILLEGMIVAIQVVRLQYYEFFSKFFTETGIRFAPFRFKKE